MSFRSDGCTLFPDIWIHECCVQHDYADYVGVPDKIADKEFLQCIAEASGGGDIAYLFGLVVVLGMIIGRPAWRFFKRIRDAN